MTASFAKASLALCATALLGCGSGGGSAAVAAGKDDAGFEVAADSSESGADTVAQDTVQGNETFIDDGEIADGTLDAYDAPLDVSDGSVDASAADATDVEGADYLDSAPSDGNSCAIDKDCGPGKVCQLGACASAPSTGKVGEPCKKNSECLGGYCITTWPNGYCAVPNCTVICPSGSSCFGLKTTSGAVANFCLAKCSGADTCNDGYICSPQFACIPGCTTDAACGANKVCGPDGYCKDAPCTATSCPAGKTCNNGSCVWGPPSLWSAVAAGAHHTCANRALDNRLYCWGYNASGELGTPSSDQTLPSKVGDDTWTAVAAGGSHTCGIRTDKSLYCWGANTHGQLGDGTKANKATPTKIGSDAWSVITAGQEYTCGIRESNGKAYCWGRGDSGQLGGMTITSPGPLALSALSAGGDHTCAVSSPEGKLYCWGNNDDGQLGNGTSCPGFPDKCKKFAPVLIGDGTWNSVAAGFDHNCALTSPGKKRMCWGPNSYGQLGDGTTLAKTIPTAAGDDSWLAIAAGGAHTCGLRADNMLFCWGANTVGQVGDGTLDKKKLNPAQVDQAAWLATAAGANHTCGLRADKTLYCWGDNSAGQLGLGTITTYKAYEIDKNNNANSPVLVH